MVFHAFHGIPDYGLQVTFLLKIKDLKGNLYLIQPPIEIQIVAEES
jgi:hypothetical protein